MRLKFISLASGSSGNCFYIGTEQYGILIDAGIGPRVIRKNLQDRGISIETIKAIFVTHDHSDHIHSVGNLSSRFHIPVYTTAEIHKGMDKNFCMTKKVEPINRHILQKEKTFVLRDFLITPFEIPHDGTDNVGYSIVYDDINFCFITDIGHITETADRYIQQANYLILEANYDEEMLMNGRYSYPLKCRISGPNGHLSNREAAEYLSSKFPPLVHEIWLCHLSNENNTPEKAYQTIADALIKVGKYIGNKVNITPLPRTSPTRIYEIN